MQSRKEAPSKGFIVVATNYKAFYDLAVYCGESIKDHFPDAHITLFTEVRFLDGRVDGVFDNIVTEGVPQHYRAKLWALTQTPYDITCYIDADCEVQHEDIQGVFDLLDDKHDLVLTRVRPYTAAVSKFPAGELTQHCGFFVFRKNEITKHFMQRWWEQYQVQRAVDADGNRVWNFDEAKYPQKLLRLWDMFTFWWLLNDEKIPLRVGFIPGEDARWNFHHGYLSTEVTKPIIVYHHEVPGKFTNDDFKTSWKQSQL